MCVCVQSDIYSYGVILYELISGKVPWDGLNAMQVVGAVAFQDKRLPVPEGVDPKIGKLMEDCFAPPAKRPSFEEVLGVLRGVIKEITPQGPPARRAVPRRVERQQE